MYTVKYMFCQIFVFVIWTLVFYGDFCQENPVGVESKIKSVKHWKQTKLAGQLALSLFKKTKRACFLHFTATEIDGK